MKALVWTDVSTMKWKEETPHAPSFGEVEITVEAVGICGSEIEGYLGHNSLRRPPLIMGHEFCGRVSALGEGARELQLGQKAVVNPLLFCGECPQCLRGLTQLCISRKIIGIHRPGAFAEKVTVPRSAVVPVPDSLDSFRAALAEPLACSLRAARRALAEHPLANVLVFGAGGIGLLSAMAAKLLGATRVVTADTNDSRLGIAVNVVADDGVNPAKEDLQTKVQAAFDGKEIDVVIDAAGFQPTREAAMRLLRPGGTFMNIGLGVDETSLPINHLIRNEVRILGSFCYTRQDFADAVQLLVDGKVTENGWTETRPMKEGGEAFAELVAGRVHNGKIFLQP